MVTPVAFDDSQVNVADCPFSIAEGETLSVIIGSGEGGASPGAGGSDGAGAGAGAFLAHPAPEMSSANRIVIRTAGIHLDLLICDISFPSIWNFIKLVPITVPSDTGKHPIELEYITRMKSRK
jgi:hypothetical protein